MATLQTKTPEVSVVIINYQSQQYLESLLTHLGTHELVEVIVVDNESSSAVQKSMQSSFPNVRYVDARNNTGFARGNNIGITEAKGEWVFLLNSDTITTSGDILSLCKHAREHNMQVAAPKLIYEGGLVQNSVGYFDGIFTHPVNGLFLRPRFLDCKIITAAITVDVATAAALLVHTSVFEKVGMFDERFFMYFEDMDFCYRLKTSGVQVLYDPSVIITHLEGKSSDQNPAQKRTNYRKSLFDYLRKYRGIGIAVINDVVGILK
jgi:GT2 family glycosyltransferase